MRREEPSPEPSDLVRRFRQTHINTRGDLPVITDLFVAR